jgi:hypothetical protein
MRWDNAGVSCCTAAVKEFVQRTITRRKRLFARQARPKLRRNVLNLSISAAKSLTSCLP